MEYQVRRKYTVAVGLRKPGAWPSLHIARSLLLRAAQARNLRVDSFGSDPDVLQYNMQASSRSCEPVRTVLLLEDPVLLELLEVAGQYGSPRESVLGRIAKQVRKELIEHPGSTTQGIE